MTHRVLDLDADCNTDACKEALPFATPPPPRLDRLACDAHQWALVYLVALCPALDMGHSARALDLIDPAVPFATRLRTTAAGIRASIIRVTDARVRSAAGAIAKLPGPAPVLQCMPGGP